MVKEKLWINCSLKEKKIVKDIERNKGWLDFLYFKRLISKDEWMYQKKRLINVLDRAEKVFSE